jgi:hypothetical protein
MNTINRREIIIRALALLRAGTLPEALPGLLTSEFGLSRSKARYLALAALKQWKIERGGQRQMTNKKRQLIITYALALLVQGTLAESLPGLLMIEFGLTPAQARELAGAALREHTAGSEAE